MMLKIQLCHYRNKLHFKIFLNRKQLYCNIKLMQQVHVMFEHKRLLSKIVKNFLE